MSILSEILATKRTEVDRARSRVPQAELERRIAELPPTLDFESILRPNAEHPTPDTSAHNPRLIAEVKKASPSKGLIRADFDPVQIARIYADGGAACISVLTDEPYFQGNLDHLRAVREAVNVPLLRKDFLFDEYQLFEARAAGADAILLIAAALRRARLEELLSEAESLGLAALVEVHDADEVDEALATRARIIGINNRDLHTFRTTLQTTLDLLPRVPRDRVTVSESGINRRQDVQRLADAGVHAVLV